MTPKLAFLLIVSQVALVASQLFLKHAMNLACDGDKDGKAAPKPWVKIVLHFMIFIAMMTFWYLLWLGFLQTMPLSQVLPWEGLSPVLLVLGAAVFLRERISREAWIGVGLISAGVVLVSLS